MGPTAVGKTPLAIELAERIDAEIICVDSIAIYRDFNIATAKPSAAETERVSHYLIDIIDPVESFSAGDFCREAKKAMEEIRKRGKNILLVGGSGLYFRALFNGMFEIPRKDFRIKEKLEEKIKSVGIHNVYEELKELDPETADVIHRNDRYRILRALEVYYTTGKRFSEFKKEHRLKLTQGPVILKIGLNLPREELYKRISERTDQMFKNGLLDEVSSLLKKYPPACKPFQSVGYKEANSFFLKGEASVEELKEEICQKTRALARRQLTWFRSEEGLQWFEPSQMDGIESLMTSFFGPDGPQNDVSQ